MGRRRGGFCLVLSAWMGVPTARFPKTLVPNRGRSFRWTIGVSSEEPVCSGESLVATYFEMDSILMGKRYR